MNFLPILALFVAAQDPSQSEQAAANPEMLPVALKRLDAMKDPAIVANRDTLRAVLERYYLHRETMKSSEFKLVDAFLEAGAGARGGSADRLANMLKSSGAAPTPPPAAPPKAHAVVKHVVKHVVAPPAPRKKTLDFASTTRRAPGGKSVGIVELRRGGEHTTLVEVYSDGGMSVGKRAAVIAARFDRLSTLDPLWWMKLKVGDFNGATIVSSPRAEKGIVVTADKPFAEACGTDPAGLARLLIRKIRDGIEPSKGGGRGMGDPEADLADAVSARQHGDELAEKDPKGAEEAYQDAIKSSAGYVVPYLRIAALRAEKGDKTGAKEILNQGLEAEGMTEAGKAELNAALAKLG